MSATITYFDGNATVTGGHIDNTIIGATTPAVATFTTSTSNVSSLSNNFDARTSTTLSIGTVTASLINIGQTGITTQVLGDLTIQQNAIISGNLNVMGTVSTINSQYLNIKDNSILLNDGYTSVTPAIGNVVVVTNPTATNTTVATGGFVAATGSFGPRVTCASNPFTSGDLILITGAASDENNGLFEFHAAVGSVLEMNSVVFGTPPSMGMTFVQSNFLADTTVAGTLTRVNVNVMQAESGGGWAIGYGDSATTLATYTGLVDGPTSSTATAIARWNGTSGTTIENSTVTVADTTGVMNFTSASGNIQIAGVNVFPTSSTTNALARYGSTTGRAITTTSVLVDNSNNMSGIVNLTNTGCAVLGGPSQTIYLNSLGAIEMVPSDVLTNASYNTNTAITGGLVTVYLPTAIQNTVAGAAFSGTTTVVTNNATTFAASDIIQIVGANNPQNNGIYEVASYIGSTITITGSPTTSFSKNTFVPDVVAAGTITQVGVAHIRANTSGAWEVAHGNVAPLSYSSLSAGITGSGIANRMTVWTGATSLAAATIVIDSSNNLDMNSASAGHIYMRNESYSITASGSQSPSASVDISFVSTDGTVCTGTLANGTVTGQMHYIIASVIGSGGRYDLTVTNFQPSNGSGGSHILRYSTTGQSTQLVWNGTYWFNANAGAIVV